MKKKTCIRALCAALSMAVAAPGMYVPALAEESAPTVDTKVVPLIAYYDEPADTTHAGWEQHASQLGNGFIGAMVHGGVGTNKIQINEHTIWSGGPGASEDYDGGAKGSAEEIRSELHKVQQDLQGVVTDFTNNYAARDDGTGKIVTKNYTDVPDYKTKDIENRVKSMFGEKEHFGSYQTLGDLYISNSDGNDTYENYSRKLDFDNSILTIEYDQNDVHYKGEYFISNPYNMMAVHLTANKAGALSKEIKIDSIQPNKSIRGDAANNVLTMEGRPSDHGENGEKFAQQVKVIANGGDTLTMGGTIYVDNADEITIYMTAGTNYKQPTKDDAASYDTNAFFSDENPLDAVKSRIDFVTVLGYDKLKKAHQEDYKKFYDAEKVDFGAKAVPEKTTDKLLDDYENNRNTADENLYLETLYYQFGRYLLISSSRDGFLNADGKISHQGELPANLQGIWADQLQNAWNSDYHTNINIQMNYWLAEQTNLTECHKPMINYINSLIPYGTAMANHYYVQPDGKTDVRGWTVGHECNIWGNAAPGESGASWFPTGAAWMCQDIWEYYQFTKDEQFLRDNYDTLLKAAQFWVDFLCTDTRDNTLVANPSYSPEHGPFSLGATCDQGIIWEIFNEVINAAEALGKSGDEPVKEVKASFDKLSNNLQIGKNGQFMEWKDETTIDVTGDNGHRHTNHLFVLHPGNQVVAGRSKADDDFINAMRVTLNTRGDGGTGWSKAWKINFWARLRDGNHAYNMVKGLLGGRTPDGKSRTTADNLFDLHAPFQIDGNFGATAGMTEMLLQSQGNSIDLLPALPDAWSKGSASGIKARGNVEVDMSWSHGYLTAAVLRPANDGEYKLTGRNIALGTIVDSKGNKLQKKDYSEYVSEATGKTENDYLVLDLKGGEEYTIYGLDNQEDVAAAKTELTELIETANVEKAKHPSTGDFYDEEADSALSAAITEAETAAAENVLFDLKDAKDALYEALEAYKASYDVQLKINLDDGVYTGIQQVKISCTSKLADIRYTTDGTTPTDASSVYSDGIFLPYGKTILKTKPFYNGNAVGEEVSAAYFIIPDTNIAKGASAAETLSNVGSTINGYPVSNVVDGNANSRWATGGTSNKDTFVEITLSAQSTFNAVLFDEFQNSASDFSRINTASFEYQDGEDWKAIAVSDSNVYLAKGEGEHYYRGVVFDAHVTAQKLRVQTNNNGDISIWEIGVYNTTVVDKTALNALITECEAINYSDYNDSDAFTAALAAAKSVASNDEATAVEVAEALSRLAAAKEAMTGSGSAEDKTLIATFSNAPGRVTYSESEALRADWTLADGIEKDKGNGIRAAGETDNTTANPYYYFEADIDVSLTDSTKSVDIDNTKLWKELRLLMRSSNDGNERRSEAWKLTAWNDEYLTGKPNSFHIKVPLSAIPSRTGNNAAVSINWDDLQEMKFDFVVGKEAAVNGKHPYLALNISNAKITTTDTTKKWYYGKNDEEPEDDTVNYTLSELNALLDKAADPDKYTDESYKTYINTSENAKAVAESVSPPQKNINRAYTALLAAYRGLTEKTQTNWVATFSNSNGTFFVLNSGSTILYDDWKQMDQGSLDVSDNIGNYRLQINVITQYDGADVNAADMLSKLTVKLRSADKSNVDGDAESGNREHNYGWDISGSALGDGSVLQLSIPLSNDCTNKKGVMDWSDIEKLIIQGYLQGDYATGDKRTACTMKISGARIIDITPVNEGKRELKALAEEEIDTSTVSDELIEAYNTAKANAVSIADSADETISLYDINKAKKDLEDAIAAINQAKIGEPDEPGVTATASAEYNENDNAVSYKFKAASDKTVSGTVVVAVYDEDNRLIEVGMRENVAADGNEVTGFIPVAEAPAKGKIFYWNSMNKISPLINAIPIDFSK